MIPEYSGGIITKLETLISLYHRYLTIRNGQNPRDKMSVFVDGVFPERQVYDVTFGKLWYQIHRQELRELPAGTKQPHLHLPLFHCSFLNTRCSSLCGNTGRRFHVKRNQRYLPTRRGVHRYILKPSRLLELVIWGWHVV